MWDLPALGIKPMSPELAGGFLTTGPPGKSCLWGLLFKNSAYESRKGQNFSTMNKYCILTLKKMKMEGLRKKYICIYTGVEDQDKF